MPEQYSRLFHKKLFQKLNGYNRPLYQGHNVWNFFFLRIVNFYKQIEFCFPSKFISFFYYFDINIHIKNLKITFVINNHFSNLYPNPVRSVYEYWTIRPFQPTHYKLKRLRAFGTLTGVSSGPITTFLLKNNIFVRNILNLFHH